MKSKAAPLIVGPLQSEVEKQRVGMSRSAQDDTDCKTRRFTNASINAATQRTTQPATCIARHRIELHLANADEHATRIEVQYTATALRKTDR
jgi:hypothetical protein